MLLKQEEGWAGSGRWVGLQLFFEHATPNFVVGQALGLVKGRRHRKSTSKADRACSHHLLVVLHIFFTVHPTSRFYLVE